LDVVFRAFDDGVAFRYEFPEQPSLKQFVIMTR
jgi:alpha-glucosidase